MGFYDPDLVEQSMSMRVELMDPSQLLDYLSKSYERAFGEKMRVDRVREVPTFRWLRSVYGPDAGRLVKWVFFKHNGLWRSPKSGREFRAKVNW